MKKKKFSRWLGNEEYHKINLKDDSLWIVKKGLDKERYIHIHPAKYSPFSIRIRAITLKTVVTLQVHSVYIHDEMKKNLEAVNHVRKNILKLSPIKSLHPDKGIFKMWKIFEIKER